MPPLTPEEASALHEGFVEDMLVALALAGGQRNDVEIHTDPAPPDAPRLRRLAMLGGGRGAETEMDTAQEDGSAAGRTILHPQVGASLGERLFRAFDRAQAEGRRYAIAIGADHPSLRAGAFVALANALEAGRDAAIIPSLDGGYCALGLARPRWDYFAGVPWSTPRVLEATLARLHSSGIEPHLFEPCCDIDVPGDLERLAREIAARDPNEADFPRRTARALAALGSKALPSLGGAARPLQEPAWRPGVTSVAYPSEKGVVR
jgi:glycosyltransferase A (GT-A) superfamily protein (DUF2064 family)